MESLASKDRTEKEKKAELKRQIAALQAQVGELDSDPESPSRASPSSPKRRKLDTVLAPATPSPKKTRRPDTNAGSRRVVNSVSGPIQSKQKAQEFVPVKPAPSTLLSMLATTNRRPLDTVETEPLIRSSAFADNPALAPPAPASSSLRRDERLALIERLEAGPADHKPPFDDPHFEQLEPNSGIRLLSRKVPHEDLQDHLRARYYLSPSRLYSAIRLLPDKQGYEVPVDGDWITIAVVAERGAYKYSKAPVEITRDEGDEVKGKAKEPPRPSGKKYINLKLVDFGAPARSSSSATGGKAVIRGDAMLSLLLFESDGWDTVPQEEGRPKRVYRGGSRGAFEEMCDLKEGDVVALLNPRVLKPFQRSNDTPHPTTNILAITPESASSIMIIGRAKDLGLCGAVKRDGKVCGSWCDKRVSDVCEWHVQNAVQQRRASRPEFSVGTSGMSTTARKQKPEYDPRLKWGLKPLNQSSGGATYVVSGHIVGGGNGADSLFVSESMGREGQAKANRKLAAREDARVLKALQSRDNDGMKAVMKAREVGLAEKDASKGSGKDKKKSASSTAKAANVDPPAKAPMKSAFSAQAIKQLGFDPTLKAGFRRHEDSDIKKKLAELDLIQSSRKEIVLTLKPGEKIRSVRAPDPKPDSKPKKPFDLMHLHDLDSDSDSDMPASVSLSKPQPKSEPIPSKTGLPSAPEVKMVDLDDF
ncbi:hypothetical protein B0H16DRAFT_1417311 [Mycena metata]|uniref:Zinc finger Mcm10/DnaG-type domain-containing protein n=1 Tax=Mycena metata TaxID=1033252 RepID=A0AAD7NDG3_9AGAR|nr:hypothetical protein B0H16DRAFT_1417311 [Mycena metata]